MSASRTAERGAAIFAALLVGLAGCGGGAASSGAAGAGGTTSGAAGTSGASGTTGAAGTAGGAGTTGGAGTGGLAGEAGVTGTASTGGAGSAGSAGSVGSTGAAGTGGVADGGAGSVGSTGAAGTGAPTDAGSATDAARSNKILIYGVTTGFRHGSITAAANAIAKAAGTFGLTSDLVGCTDATNKADATKLTAPALAQYGAVILLANSGEPFGYPATAEIQNLIDYVQHGGALVAIEDADHCYDGGFNGHPASLPYVNLIGNDFAGHPGGVAPATCVKTGTNPAVAQLPATFGTTDEIYATTMFRVDNQTVLTCQSSGDTKTRPVSYVREEGAGRVFFTALGHDDARWTAPMDAKATNSRLVEDHVIPAMLWAMRR